MTNTTTKKPSRSEELTRAIKAATSELDAARTRLGEAVADAHEASAAEARTDVARLERLLSELNAARPIALRREADAREAEREAQRRATERESNKNRKQRLAAAKKVDAALRSLGKAFNDYLATAPGGTPEDANRLARRSRSAIAAATLDAAPEFADALDVRRVMRAHRRPLAQSTEHSITEFPEA